MISKAVAAFRLGIESSDILVNEVFVSPGCVFVGTHECHQIVVAVFISARKHNVLDFAKPADFEIAKAAGCGLLIMIHGLIPARSEGPKDKQFCHS